MKNRKKLPWKKYLFYAFVAYSVFGFILVPFIVRYQLSHRVAQMLNREVSTKWVFFNPYTFKLSLVQPRIAKDETDVLFEAAKVEVNFQPLALLRHHIIIKELKLTLPNCSIQREPDGNFNFSDLIPPDSPEQTESAPAEPAQAYNFTIDHLEVINGNIAFSDNSPHTAFLKQLRNLSFSLDNLSTELGSQGWFELDTITNHAESFLLKGQVSLNPLSIRGKLDIEALDLPSFMPYLEGRIKGHIVDGALSSQVLFEAALDDNDIQASIWDTQLMLEEFRMNTLKEDEDVLGIDQLRLINLAADLAQHRIRLDLFDTTGLDLQINRRSDGSINLLELYVPDDSAETPVSDAETTPWHWEVKSLNLINSQFQLHDQALAQASELPIQLNRLSISNLDNQSEKPFQLELHSTWPQQGLIDISASGNIAQSSVQAEVSTRNWDLSPFTPYAHEWLKLADLSGKLTSQSRITWSPDQEAEVWSDIDLSHFEITHENDGQGILAWNELKLDKLHFKQAASSLELENVDLLAPKIAFRIHQDGSTNIDLLRTPATDDSESPKAEEPAPVTKPFISIEKIGVSGGTFTFNDLQQQPLVALHLDEVQGNIEGLRSTTEGRATLNFDAKVQGVAPLKIQGESNPLILESFTRLAIQLQGLEMTPFAPYFDRYVGYSLNKGVLALDLDYNIEQTLIDAENQVTIHQLTLGGKTDSPDASGLPIPLAVSLMKDASGTIDFSLPIRGDTSDPDFKYGSAVMKALGNLITKLATSPFNMLAKLANISAEELQNVPFQSGRPQVPESSFHGLDALADVMTQRPGISVEIDADIDSTVERPAMTKLKLSELLRSQYMEEEETSATVTETTPELYQEWVRKAWRSNHPMAIVDITPPSFQEMEAELLTEITVEDAELIQLARDRKEAVRNYLINQKEISPERILILESGELIEEPSGLSRVTLTIK